MNFLEGVEPLPYLMITIITWECVPLVPAKLSFRRARLEVSVISIGAIVMRLQSAVVCGHCERRIEGGATSSSHQCHNPLNTRLRRYRRLALQKHGFAGTGQAAFPTPHSGRHGSRRLHHIRDGMAAVAYTTKYIYFSILRIAVCGHCERRIEGGATSSSHQCHNPLNLALRIIAGQHGKLLAFMPSILINDVNNHLKQTVNDYCLDTVPLPCEFSSSVSSG
jgi:uncharacterized CHY-type Zn-finger protein